MMRGDQEGILSILKRKHISYKLEWLFSRKGKEKLLIGPMEVMLQAITPISPLKKEAYYTDYCFDEMIRI